MHGGVALTSALDHARTCGVATYAAADERGASERTPRARMVDIGEGGGDDARDARR